MNDISMRGRCTNLPDWCSLAKAGTLQDMATPETCCVECGKKLMVVDKSETGGFPLWLKATGGVILASFLAAGAYVTVPGLFKGPTAIQNLESKNRVTDSSTVPPSVSRSTSPSTRLGSEGEILPSYLVRLSGSNTVGGKLAPNLAAAWLHDLGASDIVTVQRKDASGEMLPERVVSGDMNGTRVGVEIRAYGTGTGVKALKDGESDVWMASAPSTDEQVATLSALGDIRSGRSEHVVGLDGIAVIVSPSNPLTSLSKAQLKEIFTGAIKNWSAFGLPSAPINLYSRDKESGTLKTFEEMVLGRGANMAALYAKMSNGYADSENLSHDVVDDPKGIGFVGMSYVGTAKPLKISDGKAIGLVPTVFSVRTENYPLSRRLYFYTAEQPKPEVTRFVEFSLSEAGQAIVQKSAVSLTPAPRPASEVDARPCQLSSKWRGDPGDFCRLRVRSNAIDASFHFKTGSSELDNLASRSLVRVMEAMKDAPDAQLVLAGFADSRGGYAKNCKLSKRRADAVKQGLAALGITNVDSRGYCDELPVRDNFGEDFEKNRRVEIFSIVKR